MIPKKRVVYFDYLRIFAAFSVVVLHVSASKWNSAEIGTFEWNVMNLFDGLQRWNVPVFVMISGALFLGREISLRKLFTKNILKIVIVYLFWSLIFALWNTLIEHNYSIKHFLREIVIGHYHMWFLLMIIGLYIIVPLLNLIVKNRRMMRYFMVLAFVFAFAIPEVDAIIKQVIPNISELISKILSDTNLHFVLGYSGYFILGYYIAHTEIAKKAEIVIYCLGLVGVAFTIGGTACFSNWLHNPTEILYGNLTINTLLVSIAVFVFFKQHLNIPLKTQKKQNWIIFMSKCTLGIYLVHPIFIEALVKYANITVLSFNPILSIVLLSLAIFIISFVTSMLLNKIPVINKWIV